MLPAVPTVAESGLPDFDLVPWVGLLAPAGTPKAVVDKVSEELARIVRSQDFSQRIIGIGRPPPNQLRRGVQELRAQRSRALGRRDQELRGQAGMTR